MALRKNLAPTERQRVVVRKRSLINWVTALAESSIPMVPKRGITSIHNCTVFLGQDGSAPHVPIDTIKGTVKPGDAVIVSFEPRGEYYY